MIFLRLVQLILVLIIPLKCDDTVNNQLTKKYISHIFNKYGTKGVITFDVSFILLFIFCFQKTN